MSALYDFYGTVNYNHMHQQTDNGLDLAVFQTILLVVMTPQRH